MNGKMLKDATFTHEGGDYYGKATEIELPKLSRIMEEYFASGMIGKISVDHGVEVEDITVTLAELSVDAIKQFGIGQHDGNQYRILGSLESDDGTEPQTLDIAIRGRWSEIAADAWSRGKNHAVKYKIAISYIKITINGDDLVEIDKLAGIEIIGGEDRTEQRRAALGR